MNEKEAVKKMSGIDIENPEIAHGQADSILATFLRDNGFKELSDAYVEKSQHFWYA